MNLAFIGAGSMTKEHLRAFTGLEDICLSGIFSRTDIKSQHLANEYNISSVYNNITELYKQTKAEAVIISVSETSLFEVCKEAFKYPWTCLIEKPIGYNYLNSNLITGVAKSYNCKVYVAFNRRHYSSTIETLKLLENEKGKRIIQIFDQENLIAAKNSGKDDLVVKNWMFANSIHLIDYFTFLGRGEITSIESIIKWDYTNPNFVLSKINYSSGDLGIYQAFWNRPGPWSVSITTEETRFELKPLEVGNILKLNSRELKYIEVDNIDKDFKPGFRKQAIEFIKAVKGLSHNLPNIEDSLKSMKLVKDIYEQ